MNCQELQKLIHAYHDGELDVANTLMVDDHLADCPRCFANVRQLSTLRGTLQNGALRFSPPPTLGPAVRAAIRQTAQAERAAPPRRWGSQLAWVAAAIAVTSLLAFRVIPSSNDDRLTAELTGSHVRSLMANHLTDVTSTDQHTVKPWFDGKLDFAPPVRELRESGFPLLGGRLDYVDGHAAAALVYGRQKHYLNLFIWPTTSATPKNLTSTQRNGYHLLNWSDGKMNYVVVSDLNETEMRMFVSEWSAK